MSMVYCTVHLYYSKGERRNEIADNNQWIDQWSCCYEREPTYFFTSGCQHSADSRMCSASHDASTTRPLSSSVRSPIQSSTYSGCSRMGTIVFFPPPPSPSPPPSGTAYDPNQALSLGTTVRSSVKRTRTSASSWARCAAYVVFLRRAGNSLLMDARKWFESRYRSSWAGSRKYCA